MRAYATAGRRAWLRVLAASLPLAAGCRPEQAPEPLVPEAWKCEDCRLTYEAGPHGTRGRHTALAAYYPPYSRRYDRIICSLVNEWPRGGQRLWVRVHVKPPEAFEVASNGIELRDSMGRLFEIGEPVCGKCGGPRDLSFPVGPQHAVESMRYNDPWYWLSLRVEYRHRGKAKTLRIGRLDPVVEAAALPK